MKFSGILLSIVAAISAGCHSGGNERAGGRPGNPAHWEYEHPDWQNQGYANCGGRVESPIDIDTSRTIKATLPPVVLNYDSAIFSIVDNGHAVQVNGSGDGSVTIDEETFEFRQLHFHYPGEHAVDGVKADMELHLVHQDRSTDDILVLGVMLKEGAANNGIGEVLERLPATKEGRAAIMLDLNEFLPEAGEYFTYTGSLTTPPCTDGIDWVVFKNPITLSAGQIENFKQLHRNNARPLQPLNTRHVLQRMP